MKRLGVMLAVSVLLNMFLIGALAGGAAWVHGRDPMIAAGSLRIAGAELPAAQRRAFRMALRETRAAARHDIEVSRTARLEAGAALRRPQPARPVVVAALAQARAADLRVRAAVEERAVDVALALPAPDRLRLADAMTRRAAAGWNARAPR